MAIATLESPGVEVSYQTTFRARRRRQRSVDALLQGRQARQQEMSWVSSSESLAGAIVVRFTLLPGEKRVVPMVISWDIPVVNSARAAKWYRRYTDFYGTSGKNALTIARDALAEFRAVERSKLSTLGRRPT